MSIRYDITVDWSVSPRIIEVAAPSTNLTCQDLHDTLRYLAAQENAIDEPEIVDSSGKEDLGGGIEVGLTVTLFDAKVKFEDRPGPSTVQCFVINGTLVTSDGSNPIAPSDYTHVVVMNQVGGVIATSSGDVEAIAAGVWNRQESQITQAGSIGLKVKTNLDAAVSSRATSGTAADAVWDEARSEHSVPGSFGEGVDLSPGEVASLIAAVVNGVWDEPRSAHNINGTFGEGVKLTAAERDAIANALLDMADSIESGYNVRYTLRLMAAVLCGKVSGGPGNPAFKAMGGNQNRVVSTADANGNRTAVILTP